METEWAKTFDLAILILLILTLAFFIEILLRAFRYRNRNQAAKPLPTSLRALIRACMSSCRVWKMNRFGWKT